MDSFKKVSETQEIEIYGVNLSRNDMARNYPLSDPNDLDKFYGYRTCIGVEHDLLIFVFLI